MADRVVEDKACCCPAGTSVHVEACPVRYIRDLEHALKRIRDVKMPPEPENLFGEAYDTKAFVAGMRMCKRIAEDALDDGGGAL